MSKAPSQTAPSKIRFYRLRAENLAHVLELVDRLKSKFLAMAFERPILANGRPAPEFEILLKVRGLSLYKIRTHLALIEGTMVQTVQKPESYTGERLFFA